LGGTLERGPEGFWPTEDCAGPWNGAWTTARQRLSGQTLPPKATGAFDAATAAPNSTSAVRLRHGRAPGHPSASAGVLGPVPQCSRHARHQELRTGRLKQWARSVFYRHVCNPDRAHDGPGHACLGCGRQCAGAASAPQRRHNRPRAAWAGVPLPPAPPRATDGQW
jgi:hypothetical protein